MSNIKKTTTRDNENNPAIIAPWYEYQKQIKALFERDPQITVGDVYEPEGREVDFAFDIQVHSHEKFVALEGLLPGIKEYGNVTLGIVMYDEENVRAADDLVRFYKTLFRDNPIVQDIRVVPDLFGTPQVYILFKPEVIQYYRDELTDYNGLFSGLAQNIARDVFEDKTGSIHFCTAPLTMCGDTGPISQSDE